MFNSAVEIRSTGFGGRAVIASQILAREADAFLPSIFEEFGIRKNLNVVDAERVELGCLRNVEPPETSTGAFVTFQTGRTATQKCRGL